MKNARREGNHFEEHCAFAIDVKRDPFSSKRALSEEMGKTAIIKTKIAERL